MIEKSGMRYRYPWHTLDEVGKLFVITKEFPEGYTHARQLVYAKNATMKRQGLPIRYKCRSTKEGMEISRIS